MERGMNKIVIVTRKTRLNELVMKYNTVEQAKFYIEHMGADFADYLAEDRQYQAVLQQVGDVAERFARVQRIERGFLPNMMFGERDIVIAVGQDGLVANVMKYLHGQPLIGVNPDAADTAGGHRGAPPCARGYDGGCRYERRAEDAGGQRPVHRLPDARLRAL